jgi:hypothetical protein
MSIKVTVRPQQSIVSSVKTSKSVVSSVNIGPKPNLNLGQIQNVDATDPDNGEVLVYDSSLQKYVVKQILIDSNNIINLIGGSF